MVSLVSRSEKGRWNDRVTMGDKESMCGFGGMRTEGVQGQVVVKVELTRVRKGRAAGTAIILCAAFL